jgi:hypothetical protein
MIGDFVLHPGKMWVISDFMRGDHGTTIKHSQLVQGCRSKGIAAVNGVEVLFFGVGVWQT